jgi:acetoin utilization protein AcuB
MTPHPVTASPDTPVTKLERLMKDDNIRHLPVLDKNNKLVGLITRESLNRALPSELTTLSIWEINYQLANIRARDVMVKKVITVTEDVTVEKAARAMIDEKIGSLLVMRNDELAGIVTDTDMLQAVTDLLGWRQPGVRVTVQVPDEKGRLAKAAAAIAEAGGLLLSSSSYTPPEPLRANIVFKVRNVPVDDLAAALRAVPGLEILDLREA